MKNNQTAILAFWSLVIPHQAIAAPEWSCLQPALEQELQQKLDYQDDLAALIADEFDDLADIASAQAMAAKTSFELRWARTQWLWETDPARFDYPDAFFSFDWSDDDETRFVSASADNRAISAKSTDLREQFMNHPDLDSFKENYFANIRESPFVELAEQFGEDSDRDAIADCFG